MKHSTASLTITSTDGVEVAVHDLGGHGRPLLVAHATGFHGRCYQALTDALGGRRHVIAPDLRGHGDTAHPAGQPVDWDRTVDDLLAVAESYGPVDGFGHSMGGACLLIAAARHPRLFRRVVVFEPIVFPPDVADTPGSNPMADAARRRRASFDSYAAAIDNYASKPPMAAWPRPALEAYVYDGMRPTDDGRVALKCTPEVEAQTFEAGRSHSGWELLPSVEHDVIVLAGRLDGTPPPAAAAAIAARLPHATLIQRDDLDHFAPMTEPGIVAELMLAALDPAPPTGT